MRAKHAKCYCGCGQAPASTCRQRLIECNGCSVKLRASRATLATVNVSCSCGGDYLPICLDDRAHAGDESAVSEIAYKETLSAVQAERGRKGAQVRKIGRAIEAAQAKRAAMLTGTAATDDLPF